MISKKGLIGMNTLSNALVIFLTLSSGVLGSLSFAHDEDPRVSIEIDQSNHNAGKIDLEFQLVDIKDKILLTDKELAVVHEKKLHVFLFDPALLEFRHEHATFEKGVWKVSATLPKNAQYWLWTQGAIAKDNEEFASSERIKVINGTPENPFPPVLGNVRVGNDGVSKVTLSNEKIIAKKMMMLTLSFSRTNGTKPKITPYLGEKAHVIGVLEDGDSLSHLHPMAGGNPNKLMLHATFEEPGEYRLWVQFIDDKALRTVPLSVVVEK